MYTAQSAELMRAGTRQAKLFRIAPRDDGDGACSQTTNDLRQQAFVDDSAAEHLEAEPLCSVQVGQTVS